MLQRVTSAAAGQFEKAVEQLIRSLHVRAEPVTATNAMSCVRWWRPMNMPDDRINGLAVQR